MNAEVKQDWSGARRAVRELIQTLDRIEKDGVGQKPSDPQDGESAFEMLFGKKAKFGKG